MTDSALLLGLLALAVVNFVRSFPRRPAGRTESALRAFRAPASTSRPSRGPRAPWRAS